MRAGVGVVRRLRLGEGGTLIKEDGKWVVDLTKCV